MTNFDSSYTEEEIFISATEKAYSIEQFLQNGTSNIEINNKEYKILAIESDPKTGFDAMAIQHPTTGEVLIVYGGTKTDSPPDINTDIEIAMTYFGGATPEQMNQAMSFYDKVKALSGENKITTSGHSLGGGMSNYVALNRNVQSLNFNSAPIPSDYLIVHKDAYSRKDIINISTANDPLTTASGALGGLLPGVLYVYEDENGALSVESHNLNGAKFIDGKMVDSEGNVIRETYVNENGLTPAGIQHTFNNWLFRQRDESINRLQNSVQITYKMTSEAIRAGEEIVRNAAIETFFNVTNRVLAIEHFVGRAVNNVSSKVKNIHMEMYNQVKSVVTNIGQGTRFVLNQYHAFQQESINAAIHQATSIKNAIGQAVVKNADSVMKISKDIFRRGKDALNYIYQSGGNGKVKIGPIPPWTGPIVLTRDMVVEFKNTAQSFFGSKSSSALTSGFANAVKSSIGRSRGISSRGGGQKIETRSGAYRSAANMVEEIASSMKKISRIEGISNANSMKKRHFNQSFSHIVDNVDAYYDYSEMVSMVARKLGKSQKEIKLEHTYYEIIGMYQNYIYSMEGNFSATFNPNSFAYDQHLLSEIGERIHRFSERAQRFSDSLDNAESTVDKMLGSVGSVARSIKIVKI